LRKVIARHIGDSNSTVRTTSSLSITNQNKTPLADITNCCLPHPCETQSKHLSHNNSNSSNDHKTKSPSKGRPQFKYDFQVNLANKFSDVTTCSSNLQPLNQSNSNPAQSFNTTPKFSLTKSTSSNDRTNKPPSTKRPQFKHEFQLNLPNKISDATTCSSNLQPVYHSNSNTIESLNSTPKLTFNHSKSSNHHTYKPSDKASPQFKFDFQVNLVNKFDDVTTCSSSQTDGNQSNSNPIESLNRSPKRKPTNAPEPDEGSIDTELSDSSEDDPWDDGSDSGTDNEDGPSSVSDTNSPSSQGNQLC
jgi:hypothetical protein